MNAPEPSPLLSQSSGTSLHRQLFLVLRDEIGRGVYSATGALPREVDLSERFNVSRVTVRRALADLAALGLVDRRHGLGTFVREGATGQPRVPTLSVLESLRDTAEHTRVKVLQLAHAVPPAEIAAALNVAPGEKVMHVVRQRAIAETPVMLTEAWVPARYGKTVSPQMLRKRALYEVLQDQGVRFGRVIQDVSSVLADPERARLLLVEVGSPVLKLSRLMHDGEDHPVLRLDAWMAGDRARLLMEIPGAAVNTLSAGQFVYDVGSAQSTRPRRAGS